jgi:hypothetical protein
MRKHLTLVLATLAVSAAAFAQFQQDGPFLIGYAANLNAGASGNLVVDNSVLNMSNDGYLAGFYPNNSAGLGNAGNICANVYAFNPGEEMISCCSCLITPNGLNSLSVQTDLVSNQLTPPIAALAGSLLIKLVSTVPAIPTTGTNLTVPTICNAGGPFTAVADPTVVPLANSLTPGLVAWGSTQEPVDSTGHFVPIAVPYLSGTLSTSELTALTTVCSFIQAVGTGFGICASCPQGGLAGALAGAKN